MSRLLLDTNLWVKCLHPKFGDAHLAKVNSAIEHTGQQIVLNPSVKDAPNIVVPAAVEAELLSFAYRNRWGAERKQLMRNILSTCLQIQTSSVQVELYAWIDAFSQGKLEEFPLPTTSRNMGKNDIWIACSALETNATLLTADYDFFHLNGFLGLRILQIQFA